MKLLTVSILAIFVYLTASCKVKSDSNLSEDSDTKSQPAALQSIKKSPELASLEKSILSVKKPEDVDRLIKQLEKERGTMEKMSKMPDDYRYLASQILPLRHYKSLVYKMIPLFDKDHPNSAYPLETSATHNMALMLLQQTAALLQNVTQSEQADAVYRYITHPFPDNAHEQFSNAEGFQHYMCSETYNGHQTAIDMIRGVDTKNPLKYDAGVFINNFNFAAPEDRFVLIGDAERNAVLGSAHWAQHNLMAFCSYNVTNLTYATETWGEIFGFDSIFADRLGGSTALRRSYVMHAGSPQGTRLETYYRDAKQLKRDRKLISKYSSLTRKTLTLITEKKSDRALRLSNNRQKSKKTAPFVAGSSTGSINMQQALKHLRASVDYTDRAWNALKSRGENVYFPLSKERFMPWGRINQKSINKIKLLVGTKQPVEISSDVDQKLSGRINLPAFYTNPPRDLRSLLPVAFRTPNESSVKSLKNGRVYKYRLFSEGSAYEWNSQAYSQYMPGVTPGGVKTVVKVLNESWGGGFVGVPLTAFVF